MILHNQGEGRRSDLIDLYSELSWRRRKKKKKKKNKKKNKQKKPRIDLSEKNTVIYSEEGVEGRASTNDFLPD